MTRLLLCDWQTHPHSCSVIGCTQSHSTYVCRQGSDELTCCTLCVKHHVRPLGLTLISSHSRSGVFILLSLEVTVNQRVRQPLPDLCSLTTSADWYTGGSQWQQGSSWLSDSVQHSGTLLLLPTPSQVCACVCVYLCVCMCVRTMAALCDPVHLCLPGQAPLSCLPPGPLFSADSTLQVPDTSGASHNQTHTHLLRHWWVKLRPASKEYTYNIGTNITNCLQLLLWEARQVFSLCGATNAFIIWPSHKFMTRPLVINESLCLGRDSEQSSHCFFI